MRESLRLPSCPPGGLCTSSSNAAIAQKVLSIFLSTVHLKSTTYAVILLTDLNL